MRSFEPYVPRRYGSLKEAQQRLIMDLKGLEVAAGKCSRARTSLHRYTDPNQPKNNMPVDIVAELESASGTNPVTGHLAALSNKLLISLPPAGARREWLDHISRVTKEFSDVLEKTSEFLKGDGDIDSHEAEKLLKEIDDALKVLGDMRVAVYERVSEAEKSVA